MPCVTMKSGDLAGNLLGVKTTMFLFFPFTVMSIDSFLYADACKTNRELRITIIIECFILQNTNYFENSVTAVTRA